MLIRRKCRFIVLLIACWFCAIELLGQNPPAFPPEQQPAVPDNELLEENLVDENSLFVPAPREVLRPFLRAQKAVNNRDYERAVALIGESLGDSGAEDYLIRVPGEDGIAISLRRRAIELLGQIPKRDRELYVLRYGIQAKQMLERAVQEGDFLKMSQVMGRFFYTPAGYDATMLVGYHHLDQGRPLAAASTFQRIVDERDAREIHDPEVSVLLATCWMLADSPDQAEQVLLALKRRLPNQTVRFMDRDLPLFKSDSDAIGWLKQIVGDSPLARNRHVKDWVMYRGNPQRNAHSGSGFPLNNYRWNVPTLNDLDLEKLAKEKKQELLFADAAMIPSVQPIAVNDTIVMRTFDRMIGVDFETGRRIWMFPSMNTDIFLQEEESVNDSDRQQSNKIPLASRMWLDSIFGQSSSDGRSVFVVPQPGFVGVRPKMRLQGGFEIYHPMSRRKFNELKAVDVSREGAFKWEVGGKTGLQEPELAGAFFLGAPLPLEGSLYGVCEQNGAIRLVVLDPETGKLLWSRDLASVETVGSIIDFSERRLAGATPSFSDGLVVCPTGIGAIVAVDITTRSLIWGYQYGQPKTRRANRIAHDQNSSSPLVDTRWTDSTITISDGCVLYTPSDSNNLITLELLTGRPLWQTGSVPRPWIQREDSLYVGCVDQQHAILIGLDYIRSIDLKTGEEAWRMYTAEYGRPSGQGYSNRGFYYLPMTSERLIKVDLRQGKLDNAVRTNGVLGNLICYRGDIISHGVDHLAVFPQDEPNKLRIEAAEKLGTLTPEQLAIKAQLLFQSDDIKEAASCILQAYEQHPKPGFEAILVDAIVKLLETDFDYAVKLLEKYADQFSSTTQPRLQSARIDGLIKQQAYREAFELLIQLLTQQIQSDETPYYLNNVGALSSIQSAPRGPAAKFTKISIRFDRWLESRLRTILKKAPAPLHAEFVLALNQRIGELDYFTPLQTYAFFTKLGIKNFDFDKTLELAQSLEKLNENLRASHLRRAASTTGVTVNAV